MASPSPGPTAASKVTLHKILPKSSISTWTRHQNKFFEVSLARVEEATPNRWMHVAEMVPGKNAMEAKQHYDLLVEDVLSIEAGRVPLPDYIPVIGGETMEQSIVMEKSNFVKKPLAPQPVSAGRYMSKGAGKQIEQERRKGIPWTEEEHRLFLLGLDRYGKGDWRSISRNFVVSRTPTQVASHAQKYFIRQSSTSKDNKRRSSIHDITTADGSDNALPTTPASSSGPQSSAGQPSLLIRSPVPAPTVYAPPVVGQPLMAAPILLRSPPPFPLMPVTPLPTSSIPMPHFAYAMPQPAMHQL